jgi:sulfate/thiosulfate transport system permease protein
VQSLEQFDYAGAAALGVAMLAFSFALLLLVTLLQRWSHRWAAVAP